MHPKPNPAQVRGLCWCGCGEQTPIARVTRSERGDVRGQPIRYIAGHYQRTQIRRSAVEVVLDHLELDGSGCWVFKGPLREGYGRVRDMSRHSVQAHRVMYEACVGQIPAGLHLDHLCRNRACVNPAHMELVTNRENLRRGNGISAINARKTHCDRGHEFTPENTRIRTSGYRQCRECARITERSRRTKAAA